MSLLRELNKLGVLRTLDDALARKTAGLARVEATHPDFVPRLRAAARAYALQHGTVTADDVRRLADELGLRPGHAMNPWGSPDDPR